MNSFTSYKFDRAFTDHIHNNIVTKTVYPKFGWNNLSYDEEIDRNDGIDYVVHKDRKKIYLQERFRDMSYKKYNDFTIRYRRDYSDAKEQMKSEFYKIKADFLVYGIVNTSKKNYQKADSFFKILIVNLDFLRGYFQSGKIILKNNKSIRCIKENNTLVCPIIQNRDRSSSFIAFDVHLLISMFSDDFIKYQKGYIK